MLNTILVAVSRNSSDSVIALAVEPSGKYGAQIAAMHVVDPRPCYLGAPDFGQGLIVEAMQADGSNFVREIKKAFDRLGVSAEVHMLTLPVSGATISGAIADVAEETGADLILLGDRSSSHWGWLREEVVAQVISLSHRPVQIATKKGPLKTASFAGSNWFEGLRSLHTES